jgi:hypothetical protein
VVACAAVSAGGGGVRVDDDGRAAAGSCVHRQSSHRARELEIAAIDRSTVVDFVANDDDAFD